MFGQSKKTEIPTDETALAGRTEAISTDDLHFLNGNTLKGPYPEGFEVAVFGMGCFCGVERMFWDISGVWVTSVGYAGGYTPNATYEEICSGQTGHTEVVQVVFDPSVITYEKLLQVFWEGHDPTQGMRQGNDRGTQYRSAIYTANPEQHQLATTSKEVFQKQLSQKVSAQSPPKSQRRASITMPKDTTSSILLKILTDIAELAEQGSPAPSVWVDLWAARAYPHRQRRT